MALRIAKDVDPMKVRGVKIMKKQEPLYRKVKKYRLMNQIPLSDMQSLSTDTNEIEIGVDFPDSDIPIKNTKKMKSQKSKTVKDKPSKLSESEKSEKPKLCESKSLKTSETSKTESIDNDDSYDIQEISKSREKQKSNKIRETREIDNKSSQDKRENNTDLREDIEYIIKETDHLDYLHRKEILTMILDQGYSEFVSESSDGTRIDMSKLPVDMINQIKNFVTVKLKTIDITDRFEALYNEKKDDPSPSSIESDTVAKKSKSTKSTKNTKSVKK